MGLGEVAFILLPQSSHHAAGTLGCWHDSWDPFFGIGLIIFYSGSGRFLFPAASCSGRSEPVPRRVTDWAVLPRSVLRKERLPGTLQLHLLLHRLPQPLAVIS